MVLKMSTLCIQEQVRCRGLWRLLVLVLVLVVLKSVCRWSALGGSLVGVLAGDAVEGCLCGYNLCCWDPKMSDRRIQLRRQCRGLSHLVLVLLLVVLKLVALLVAHLLPC